MAFQLMDAVLFLNLRVNTFLRHLLVSFSFPIKDFLKFKFLCYLFLFMDKVLSYCQALLSAMIKRIRGYIKLRKALGSLHAALPDATAEELQAYDDECAICRVCVIHPAKCMKI